MRRSWIQFPLPAPELFEKIFDVYVRRVVQLAGHRSPKPDYAGSSPAAPARFVHSSLTTKYG